MPTDARAINDMVDIVNVLRNLNFDCTQFNVTIDTAVRVRLKKTQEIPGFPWGDRWPFGLGLVMPTSPGAFGSVTIYNPMLRRYGDPQGAAPNQTICYTCADATIAFTGNGSGQRICWQWDNSSGSGAVFSIMLYPQVNDPIDAGEILRGVVAIFDVTNGVPALATGGSVQCGQIITLPMFAPATV